MAAIASKHEADAWRKKFVAGRVYKCHWDPDKPDDCAVSAPHARGVSSTMQGPRRDGSRVHACARARVRAFARSRVRATGKLVVATRPESLLQRGRYVCCAREICLLRVRAVWVELLVVVARAPAAILSRSGSPEAHTVRYLPFHPIPYHHQPSHASRSGSRARLVRLTRILVDRRRPARLPF